MVINLILRLCKTNSNFKVFISMYFAVHKNILLYIYNKRFIRTPDFTIFLPHEQMLRPVYRRTKQT